MGYLLAGVVLLPVAPTVHALWPAVLTPEQGFPSPWIPTALTWLGGTLIFGTLLTAAGNLAGRRAWKKTAAFYAALPFPLEGWQQALGQQLPPDGSTPRRRRFETTLQVSFTQNSSNLEFVREMLRAGRVIAARENLVVRRRVILVGHELTPQGFTARVRLPGTTRQLHLWLRRVLLQVLVPMHHQHPIARVRVSVGPGRP